MYTYYLVLRVRLLINVKPVAIYIIKRATNKVPTTAKSYDDPEAAAVFQTIKFSDTRLTAVNALNLINLAFKCLRDWVCRYHFGSVYKKERDLQLARGRLFHKVAAIWPSRSHTTAINCLKITAIVRSIKHLGPTQPADRSIKLMEFRF